MDNMVSMNQSYYGWGLPINISAHGAEIDRLIWVVHGLMLILFVGWMIFLITALVRFRQRKGHQPNHHNGHFKAPTYVEIAVAVFEVLLLFGFAFPLQYRIQKQFPPEASSLRL